MMRVLPLLLVVMACSPPPIRAPERQKLPDAYPGTLLPPSAMGPDRMLRQRVDAHWGPHSRGFDAVLQKQGDKVQIIGLTPFSTPAFVVTLQDGKVTLDNRTGEHLPFPPRYIILDVQRVFFPWLSDGELSGEQGGEEITEVRRAGRLVERRFKRTSGRPRGTIRVTYDDWSVGKDAPKTATLDNGWFGYKLVIKTLEQRRL